MRFEYSNNLLSLQYLSCPMVLLTYALGLDADQYRTLDQIASVENVNG